MTRPPTHPGEVLKHDIFLSLRVTQDKFSEMLGLSRKTINEIFAGKSSISAETAVKLGTLFGNEPQFWLNMQSSYDIWVARQQLQGSPLLGRLEMLRGQMRELSGETAIGNTLSNRIFD